MNQEQKKQKLREITDRIQIAMQNNVMTVSDDLDEREVAEAAAKVWNGGYKINPLDPTVAAARVVVNRLSGPMAHKPEENYYPPVKMLSPEQQTYWRTGGDGSYYNEQGEIDAYANGVTIPSDVVWRDHSDYPSFLENQGMQEVAKTHQFLNNMQWASPEGAARREEFLTHGQQDKMDFISTVDGLLDPQFRDDVVQHELTHKFFNMSPGVRGYIRSTGADEEDLVRTYDHNYGRSQRSRDEGEEWVNGSIVGNANEFDLGYGDRTQKAYNTIESAIANWLSNKGKESN